VRSSEILCLVHELLGDPDKWCVGALSRDPAGNPVDPCSTPAVAWSVPGACHRVSGDEKAWDQCRPHVLAFSPGLGRNGEIVSHESMLARVWGAYLHAYITEAKR
jgi:hypothetical protein